MMQCAGFLEGSLLLWKPMDGIYIPYQIWRSQTLWSRNIQRIYVRKLGLQSLYVAKIFILIHESWLLYKFLFSKRNRSFPWGGGNWLQIPKAVHIAFAGRPTIFKTAFFSFLLIVHMQSSAILQATILSHSLSIRPRWQN